MARRRVERIGKSVFTVGTSAHKRAVAKRDKTGVYSTTQAEITPKIMKELTAKRKARAEIVPYMTQLVRKEETRLVAGGVGLKGLVGNWNPLDPCWICKGIPFRFASDFCKSYCGILPAVIGGPTYGPFQVLPDLPWVGATRPVKYAYYQGRKLVAVVAKEAAIELRATSRRSMRRGMRFLISEAIS